MNALRKGLTLTCLIPSFISATIATTTLAGEDVMARPRLEKMLADGDTDWIVETMRRHPDNVLSFVDSYLEGGLKMIEDGKSESDARDSFRKGLEFAKLADRAFNEMIFSQYAASFGSWSPSEQKQFRQGQAEFGAGRKIKDDPAASLLHYQKSLELSKPLNDSWGMAMAYFSIAKSEFDLGNHDKSREAAMKSSELNGRLRLRISHIRSRLMCGQIYARTNAPASGRGHLRIAWEQIKPTDDPKLRTEVLDAYCISLEAAGNARLAASLRKKHETPSKKEVPQKSDTPVESPTK